MDPETTDERWSFLPGIGRVPSAPRLNRLQNRSNITTVQRPYNPHFSLSRGNSPPSIERAFNNRANTHQGSPRPPSTLLSIKDESISDEASLSGSRYRSLSPHDLNNSSLGQRPKPKKPWRYHDGEPQPPRHCECAFTRSCTHLPTDHKHDHRMYAPDIKTWRKRTGEVKVTRRFEFSRPKNLRSLVHEVARFGPLSEVVMSGSQDCFQKMRAIEGIREWVSLMRQFDVRLVHRQSEINRLLTKFGRWITREGGSAIVKADIEDDLRWLRSKWKKGHRSPDLDLSNCLRGILVEEKDGIVVRSLDPGWLHYRRADQFGHNGLVVGECWPLRICMNRDGAHGAIEAGIYGKVGEGAYSIVLSEAEGDTNYYADQDYYAHRAAVGELMAYVGTKGAESTPTQCTQTLLDSKKTGNPVRCFRGWRCLIQNKLRPEDGFRYDGLYQVVDWELLDEETAVYRFFLKRMGGEGRIRIDRPDRRELKQYKEARDQLKAQKRKRS